MSKQGMEIPLCIVAHHDQLTHSVINSTNYYINRAYFNTRIGKLAILCLRYIRRYLPQYLYKNVHVDILMFCLYVAGFGHSRSLTY